MTALKTIKALQRLSAPHTVRVKNTFIEWVDPGDSDMKRSSSCPLLPGVPTRGTSPARNSHLKLASRKNTFDTCWPAGNAPTASNAMHDWRNSRADGHVDHHECLPPNWIMGFLPCVTHLFLEQKTKK
eukprot:GEMP01053156.1.p1 GENE.GEMP01053156.1~~GEMP01053156.1.p1  ORF type:complete len:128 (+),score=13.88 GEMP01053156.1:294-677(+)